MPRPAPQLPNLECQSCICFAAEQPPTKLVHIHFELEVLVAFEDGVFHDLTHYVLQFTQPEVKILVPISRALPHVEGLDAARFIRL